MKIELFQDYPATSTDKVKEVEGKLNIKFPNEYIEFLLDQNGGYPKICYFSLPDGTNKSLVNGFYPIGEMKSNLLRVNFMSDFPEGFISIGDDPGGNEILLGVSEENFQNIYFWEHDVDPDEKNPLHFLANSLNEFLNVLKAE